jgi:hypothetical protein
MAESVYRRATGWTAGVRFPAGVRNFSVLHSVQSGSGSFSLPFNVYLGVKRPGHEADHSPPSNAMAKNGGAIPPLPHMSSRHSAKLIKQGQLYLFHMRKSQTSYLTAIHIVASNHCFATN